MQTADILAAVREQSEPGYVLARRLRTPASTVRRWLLKLEKQGIVERCPRYSICNSVSWRICSPAPDEQQ